ncbi:histone deacetylase family protein [Luteimonas deserti]|uniref:Histone deacetylase family protein n=1 Tax=Luteimonas deserti TaxID=2752306 RepID=A0A7Z0TUX8_9GAMM|nr:histone deacetylase family protein [Luteimonas deserti]NYZ61639.1 histone deacetylase family protein [Luteimonas deserti]
MPVFSHASGLDHDTGPGHAERPERLAAVIEALRAADPQLDLRQAPAATRGQLLRVHDETLLATVLESRPTGRIPLDADTVLSPGSAQAALHAAGAGIAAVELVFAGEARRAFCAVRPPGHHATRDIAMGFCLFNSIAVAAAHALDRFGLTRVSIIDFDVHHGNGTQAIFEAEPRVQYVSSHQLPLYPDTGQRHERGVGNIVNLPLPPRTDGARFRAAWGERLLPEIDAFAPQLVLVSAGFDAHRLDPLAQLELDATDFAWLTRELVALADRHAEGRLVSMLEGGYDLDALRACSVAHLQALSD